MSGITLKGITGMGRGLIKYAVRKRRHKNFILGNCSLRYPTPCIHAVVAFSPSRGEEMKRDKGDCLFNLGNEQPGLFF